MQEWKARSKAYHTLETKYEDDLTNIEIMWRPQNIVNDAVKHFNEKVDEWIYPAKSYFVAICYANWIALDFNENFLDVLNDSDLLPHDPYFVPYSKDQSTYDDILWHAGWENDEQGMVPDVRKYYEEEMLFDKL